MVEDIYNLGTKKASQDTDIPARILKENTDITANFLYLSYNDTVMNCSFPSILKNANVIPIYKRHSRMKEKSYFTVSILPKIWKIFEKFMHCQMSLFFDDVLSKYQFGFRQVHSSQQCLLVMTEK